MPALEAKRTTRETDVQIRLELSSIETTPPESVLEIGTGVPFFDHMLHAMLFHGGFRGQVNATGDTAIDDHHTVEDVGIVLGSLFARIPREIGPVARFGHALVPMDDALAEVVVDAGGRSFLEFRVEFPQPYAGKFDLALIREFFTGFSHHAAANLHLIGRYGINGHHLAEAVFKAAGRALRQAYAPAGNVLSTKGVL